MTGRVSLASGRAERLFAVMWFDPVSGQFLGDPKEVAKQFAEAIRRADPLMRKAWLHFDQLTPDEKNELALRLLSSLGDYLPDSNLRELIAESANRAAAGIDSPVDEAARQMLAGKLAGRELGAMRQEPLRRALYNPQTGQIFTEEDAAAALRQLRAKRRKKRAKKKAKRTAKKKPAAKTVRKPAKAKRRKRR